MSRCFVSPLLFLLYIKLIQWNIFFAPIIAIQPNSSETEFFYNQSNYLNGNSSDIVRGNFSFYDISFIPVVTENSVSSVIEAISAQNAEINDNTSAEKKIEESLLNPAEVEHLLETSSDDDKNDFISGEVPKNQTLKQLENENVNVENPDYLLTLQDEKILNNLTEEIPSFSEWAQKRLEEAEKNEDNNNNNKNNNTWNNDRIKSETKYDRKHAKNYASPDCGAKIVAANPEAISPGSVLSSSRDEYKLNKCTSRIWFVVELCEAIQAKKVELANFELFSSSPKEFAIFVSDRFPTRDWLNVGQFVAKDERDVQTFHLHPIFFGKYIKFEMYSHHGSEHYCPISMFKVYGTSEFEVLETEDLSLHSNGLYEDDDDVLDFANEDVPKNLLSSATDAVMSIVKKAAEVLGKKDEKNNNSNNNNDNNVTVTKISNDTITSNCITPLNPIVCLNCTTELNDSIYKLISCSNNFIHFLLSHFSSLISNCKVCNRFGISLTDNKNKSDDGYSSSLIRLLPDDYLAAVCNVLVVAGRTYKISNCKQDEEPKDVSTSNDDNVQDIINDNNDFVNDSNLETNEQLVEVELTSDGDNLTEVPNEITEEDLSNVTETEMTNNTNETTMSEETFEIVSSEIIENINQSELQSHSTPVPQNKESVFIRLTARIKSLERNMSLSSQYLEELSKRYKKQVEEMQRLLDKTIGSLNDEKKRKEYDQKKLEKQMEQLTSTLETLINERNFWLFFLNWTFIFVFGLFFLWFFCRSKFAFGGGRSGTGEAAVLENLREKSDCLTTKKKRKCSDGITAPFSNHTEGNSKKKQKKRKERIQRRVRRRSENCSSQEELKYRTIRSEVSFPFTDSVKFKDTPFPVLLDTPEHSAVEPLFYVDFNNDREKEESVEHCDISTTSFKNNEANGKFDNKKKTKDSLQVDRFSKKPQQKEAKGTFKKILRTFNIKQKISEFQNC